MIAYDNAGLEIMISTYCPLVVSCSSDKANRPRYFIPVHEHAPFSEIEHVFETNLLGIA